MQKDDQGEEGFFCLEGKDEIICLIVKYVLRTKLKYYFYYFWVLLFQRREDFNLKDKYLPLFPLMSPGGFLQRFFI